MKIRVLTGAALLALFASTSASAGKLTIDTTNYSSDAIAVGDTLAVTGAITPFGAGGALLAIGSRAEAGSVRVNADGVGCACKRKVTVYNDSMGALAVGNASAGSTVIKL